MGKKTKKQKIISQKRREFFILQQYNKSLERDEDPTKKTNKNLLVDQSIKTLSNQDKTIQNYFLQDFKKSVFIIVLIIALEIVLYFGTINKYFN